MTRFRPWLVAFCLLGLACADLAACADKAQVRGDGISRGDAVVLGQRKVDLGADHDVIRVTAREGRFRAIGVRVGKTPLEMHGIRVTFGDGSTFTPATRLTFGRGSWSRRIDLPGGARVIRKVEFLYRSKARRTGRAVVTLVGVR